MSMINFLNESVIGHILGNIDGFIRSVVYKEDQPLWKSGYMLKENSQNMVFSMFITDFLLFAFGLFFLLAPSIQYVGQYGKTTFVSSFYEMDPSYRMIIAVIFVTGGMLLTSMIHWLDRLYIYPDRIERRFFFHAYEIIPYAKVIKIQRDKTTQTNAHILYEDPWFGISQIGEKKLSWSIPVSIFSDNRIGIEQEKLDPNLFVPFSSIAHDLPDSPFQKKKKGERKPLTHMEILTLLSMLIVNPYFVTIYFVSSYGLLNLPWYSFVCIDLSGAFGKWALRTLMASHPLLEKKM